MSKSVAALCFLATLAMSGLTQAHADSCSDESGECQAGEDIAKMGKENPITRQTPLPDEAQKSVESQPDYTGDSSDTDNSSNDDAGGPP